MKGFVDVSVIEMVDVNGGQHPDMYGSPNAYKPAPKTITLPSVTQLLTGQKLGSH